MGTGSLGAGSRASQRFNASGEATEQETLPAEYMSTPLAASPISGHMMIPTDHTSFVPGQPNAVVRRWPRMNGMRYLYARGMTLIPVHNLGADGPAYPWNSGFNKNSHGPTHDAGFNDSLYQAGYPGFNLGLSFKVPTPDRSAVGTGGSSKVQRPVSQAVNRLRRATGAPRER